MTSLHSEPIQLAPLPTRKELSAMLHSGDEAYSDIPEKYLWAACLQQAMFDITHPNVRPVDQNDAYAWILRNDFELLNSFVNVCDMLNCDYLKIRKAIIAKARPSVVKNNTPKKRPQLCRPTYLNPFKTLAKGMLL